MSQGKRFGGTYSKGGATSTARAGKADLAQRFAGRRPSGKDVRALLMYALPTPLLFAVLGRLGGGDAIGMLVLLGAYAALLLGAYLLREGQEAERAFDERPVARPPAVPRKILAAAFCGAGVGAACLFGWGIGLVASVGFAAITAVCHVAAFGIDPLKGKGVDNVGAAELDRVTDALDKAEGKLRAIETHAHTLGDREVDARITALNRTVREMIAMVERDPGDLGRARRYLGVYLQGAADATRKYAENAERLNDPALRTDYLKLLGDLEESFGRGKETLLRDDRTDLEVEIEVLRERLARE